MPFCAFYRVFYCSFCIRAHETDDDDDDDDDGDETKAIMAGEQKWGRR